MKIYLPLLALIFFIGCRQNVDRGEVALAVSHPGTSTDKAIKLDPKWYEGQAEITVYDLKQNRYNGIHPGRAINIFVTEDFLTDKQVKNDSYTSSNSVSILKNNHIRSFTTGLYAYSMYTSVFTQPTTPRPTTHKMTMSSQDWCGQSFMQLNRKGDKYRMSLYSYFESEGDQTQKVPGVLTEDELFTWIRINPELLPIGQIEILPALMTTRLRHLEYRPYKAKSALSPYSGDTFTSEQPLMAYWVEIPELKSTLEIIFEKDGLRDIVGWIESYPSAFDKQIRTTIAQRRKSVWKDYWNFNAVRDSTIRAELGL